MLRDLILFFVLLSAGCSSLPMSGYISRNDHPYERKIYGKFEKVLSSLNYILKQKGWKVQSEVDPAVYERDERYDNNGFQNVLIITEFRENNHVVSSTYTHLNIFVHSYGNACDVEIRYEARTNLVKQLTSVRNDQLADSILDALQDEVSR